MMHALPTPAPAAAAAAAALLRALRVVALGARMTCNGSIACIVEEHLGLDGVVDGGPVLPLPQLLLQRDAGVVRAEHLGAEVGHEGLEVFIQLRGRQQVEDVVGGALARAERAQVLHHARVQLHGVAVGHAVLAEEVEGDDVAAVGVEGDVLHAQRAATHRVRFLANVLLVAEQYNVYTYTCT